MDEVSSQGGPQNAHPPFAEVTHGLPEMEDRLAVCGEGKALARKKGGKELIVEMFAEKLRSLGGGQADGVKQGAPESVTGRINQRCDGVMKEGAEKRVAGRAGAFGETGMAQQGGAYFADRENKTAHAPGLKRRRRGRGWGTRRPGE